MAIIVDVPEPFSDLPPRDPERGDVGLPGRPSRLIPGEVWREGLWTVVRDHETGEVIRVWDAPHPGTLLD